MANLGEQHYVSHYCQPTPARLLLAVPILLLLAVLAACQAEPQQPRSQPLHHVAPEPARDLDPQRGPADAPQADYWPTEDWQTARPRGAWRRCEAAERDDGLHQAQGAGHPGRCRGARRLRRLRAVCGGTWARKSRGEVYSVTKSFASTLVGIAQRKGLLTNLDAKILDLLPGTYENVDERKQAMTLEDVLTMRTGLAWTMTMPRSSAFYSSSDPMKFMLDRADGGGAGDRLQLLLGVLAPADHARVEGDGHEGSRISPSRSC